MIGIVRLEIIILYIFGFFNLFFIIIKIIDIIIQRIVFIESIIILDFIILYNIIIRPINMLRLLYFIIMVIISRGKRSNKLFKYCVTFTTNNLLKKRNDYIL